VADRLGRFRDPAPDALRGVTGHRDTTPGRPLPRLTLIPPSWSWSASARPRSGGATLRARPGGGRRRGAGRVEPGYPAAGRGRERGAGRRPTGCGAAGARDPRRPTALLDVPPFKPVTAYTYPLGLLGVTPVDVSAASRLVVICDDLFQAVVGAACRGPRRRPPWRVPGSHSPSWWTDSRPPPVGRSPSTTARPVNARTPAPQNAGVRCA